ncbi:hypothetical protein PL321_03040 [Caloramator sp. mosi_1]|nr:hypothetical protein [Caloramator sp. mosi_1]WDC85573.1 hypothetical protein PL321_03040 [Caloramator sp. mosi_1]
MYNKNKQSRDYERTKIY